MSRDAWVGALKPIQYASLSVKNQTHLGCINDIKQFTAMKT